MFLSSLVKFRTNRASSIARAVVARRFHTSPFDRSELAPITKESSLQTFDELYTALEDQINRKKDGQDVPELATTRKNMFDTLKALGKPTYETAGPISTGIYSLALCTLAEGGSVYTTLKNLQTSFSVAEGILGWGPLITTKVAFELVRIYKYLNQIDCIVMHGEKALVGAEIHAEQFSSLEVTDIADLICKAYFSRKRHVEAFNVANRVHHMLHRRYRSHTDQEIHMACFLKMEVIIATYHYYQREFVQVFEQCKRIEDKYISQGVFVGWPWGEADSKIQHGIINFIKGGSHLSLKNIRKAELNLMRAIDLFKEADNEDGGTWLNACEQSLTKLNSLKEAQEEEAEEK